MTVHTKGLFARRARDCYPFGRVTLVSGLKLALVYKQISQVGLLTYHLCSTLPALLTCFVMRDILCNGRRFEILMLKFSTGKLVKFTKERENFIIVDRK